MEIAVWGNCLVKPPPFYNNMDDTKLGGLIGKTIIDAVDDSLDMFFQSAGAKLRSGLKKIVEIETKWEKKEPS